MRTYSTRKNSKSQNTDFDAVFSGVHEQSAETESSENETLNSKKRKNKMTKFEKSKLKRSKKQTPVSVETEISKQSASKSEEDMTIPINNSDSLFADPMDVGKKNRSRSQKKTTQVSQTQVGSVDKVSQWLAGSQYTDLSEKEIFRDLPDHPMERRHDMFPDLQCDGLQTKPRRSLSHDPASRVEFLSKFEQKKTITGKPTVKQGVTRSWTVSATETLNQDTGSTDIGTTDMDTETATPITGMMTETQGDLVTAYTDTQTPIMEDSDVTKHMSILTQAPRKYMSSTFRRSISADTFPSELSTVTESLIRKKREEKTPKRRTDDFKVPSLPTKSAPKTTQKKGSLHPKNSAQLFTSGCVEIVDVFPQMSTKIMDQSSKNSNTAQKVVKKTKPEMQTSTPNIGDSNEPHFQFDIWLLMIFVGLAGLVGLGPAIQQEDISTKSATKTTQKKGSLQMSTKIMDQSSKNSTTAQKVVSSMTEDIDTAVVKKTKPVLQTSTPNIGDSNEPHFQFDADISSVTDEPENESELVFNQSSRFVNSNELMELSSSQIEQIDENVTVTTARKQDSSRSYSSTQRHTDIGQSHEQLVNDPNDNSEFEPELRILPDGRKIFGSIRKTLRFSSSSSTPQGRRGSSNSTGQGKMFTNQTDIGQSPEQLVNEPNDNSEFEPEIRRLPDGRKIFGANLVSSSSSTPQGRRGSSKSSRSTWRSKMFTYRTDVGKPTERVVNETKDNNNSVSEPELRRLPDGRYVPVCPLMYSGPVRHKKNATNLMFTTKN